MWGNWWLREDPSNWRPYLVTQFSSTAGVLCITWGKSIFLSILRSWDFTFRINGSFFIWLKFSLASYSVGSIPFFWSLLIMVFLMTLSFKTSLFPGTSQFLKTLVQTSFLGTSVSWLSTSVSWRYGVVVITSAQLHSTKPELRFCSGSNPARRWVHSRWWVYLTMVPAGNKAKRHLSINHTTKKQFNSIQFRILANVLKQGHYVVGRWVLRPPAPRPSYPALGPRPHKSFNQLNLFLGKDQSRESCAHYFQWFTGYLKHVVLLMSQVHVSKKLSYFLMCTLIVLWILSCAQLRNACSKLIIPKIRLICMCSNLEINTAWLRSFVFIVDFDHSQQISIVFLVLTLNKYLPVGCERRAIMFWKPYFKVFFIQQFIIAPNWNKLQSH